MLESLAFYNSIEIIHLLKEIVSICQHTDKDHALYMIMEMDHVPAFKAEDYMLSKKNFLSKVSFELKSYTKPNGRTTRYAKTWKDAEKKIKYKFLDNQSSKKSYFKRNVIPETILNTKDSLEKAKKIYQLIKENFNWNEKYWPSEKVNIKEAYEEKVRKYF